MRSFFIEPLMAFSTFVLLTVLETAGRAIQSETQGILNVIDVKVIFPPESPDDNSLKLSTSPSNQSLHRRCLEMFTGGYGGAGALSGYNALARAALAAARAASSRSGASSAGSGSASKYITDTTYYYYRRPGSRALRSFSSSAGRRSPKRSRSKTRSLKARSPKSRKQTDSPSPRRSPRRRKPRTPDSPESPKPSKSPKTPRNDSEDDEDDEEEGADEDSKETSKSRRGRDASFSTSPSERISPSPKRGSIPQRVSTPPQRVTTSLQEATPPRQRLLSSPRRNFSTSPPKSPQIIPAGNAVQPGDLNAALQKLIQAQSNSPSPARSPVRPTFPGAQTSLRDSRVSTPPRLGVPLSQFSSSPKTTFPSKPGRKENNYVMLEPNGPIMHQTFDSNGVPRERYIPNEEFSRLFPEERFQNPKPSDFGRIIPSSPPRSGQLLRPARF